jgi:hypothetical protein
MNQGRTIFSQLMEFFPHKAFAACVARHGGERYVKSFSCMDQFLCMAFAQLAYRESMRATDLACSERVRPGRYRQETAVFGRSLALHNSTDFERIAVREKAHSTGTLAPTLYNHRGPIRQPVGFVHLLIGHHEKTCLLNNFYFDLSRNFLHHGNPQRFRRDG